MNDNIIAVNVPNAISILVMAIAGGIALAIGAKFLGARGASGGGSGG